MGSRRLTVEDDDALEELMHRLGHRFAAPALLDEALTHPSLLANDRPKTFERLEFLGDRVLGIIVAEMLWYRFPDEPEGSLAKRFAVLAQRETLAEVAEAMELGRFLKISSSEEQGGGRENPAILADALEAVFGALYIDGGLEAARGPIESAWTALLTQDLSPPQDPKTALQEWAQARGLALPRYREIGRDGPPHEPLFTIEVRVPGRTPTSGVGRSKRAAERAAALAMLQELEPE
jgi:ribonuclease III